MDATIVLCHSDKELATPTWKSTFGVSSRCCVSRTTPAKRCPGCCAKAGAGSNTTTDHITVLDDALTQIPDARVRHPDPDPVRPCRLHYGFLAHVRGLRAHRLNTRSRSGSPSPNRSDRRSWPPNSGLVTGCPPSTPTASPAMVHRSANSPAGSPVTATRPGPGSSCAGNGRTPGCNCRCSTRSRSSPPGHRHRHPTRRPHQRLHPIPRSPSAC